jgi:hypothetical protein
MQRILIIEGNKGLSAMPETIERKIASSNPLMFRMPFTSSLCQLLIPFSLFLHWLFLFETLPYPTYQTDDIDLKANLVYEHLKHQYFGGEKSIYGQH